MNQDIEEKISRIKTDLSDAISDLLDKYDLEFIGEIAGMIQHHSRPETATSWRSPINTSLDPKANTGFPGKK
jgi:hypothetical protein